MFLTQSALDAGGTDPSMPLRCAFSASSSTHSAQLTPNESPQSESLWRSTWRSDSKFNQVTAILQVM